MRRIESQEVEDTEKRMQAALKAWENKEFRTKTQAASYFDVDYGIFARRAHNRPGVPPGRGSILDANEERILKDWLCVMNQKGLPVRPWELICCALLLVRERPYDSAHVLSRIDREVWPKGFIKRSERFAIDMLRGLVFLRDVTGLADLVKSFVATVNQKIDEHFITEHDVYCVSESGFQMRKVANLIGAGDEAYFQTQEKERVTFLDCSDANGLTLQPYVGRYTASPNSSAGVCDIKSFPKNWDRHDIRLNWLQTSFIPRIIAKNHEGYTILIINWHTITLPETFISTCDEHKIIPFCVPENSWKDFMALDQTGSVKMKHLYKDATQTIFSDPDDDEFLKYLKKFIIAKIQVAKQATIKQNFSKLGFKPSGLRRRPPQEMSRVHTLVECETIVVSSGDSDNLRTDSNEAEISGTQRASEPDTAIARSEVPDAMRESTAEETPCSANVLSDENQVLEEPSSAVLTRAVVDPTSTTYQLNSSTSPTSMSSFLNDTQSETQMQVPATDSSNCLLTSDVQTFAESPVAINTSEPVESLIDQDFVAERRRSSTVMTLPDLLPVEGDEPGPSADDSTENLAGPDVFQDEASQGGTEHVTPAAEIEEPASTKVMEDLPPVVEHEMKESEVISSSEGPSREGDSSYELLDENSVHESPGDEMLQVKRKTSSSDRDTLAKRTRSSSTEAISSESTNQRCKKKRPSTASPLPTMRKLRSS
ncbi:hypothetical protein OXX69_006687 [Metschnikowia pulcherrima]